MILLLWIAFWPYWFPNCLLIKLVPLLTSCNLSSLLCLRSFVFQTKAPIVSLATSPTIFYTFVRNKLGMTDGSSINDHTNQPNRRDRGGTAEVSLLPENPTTIPSNFSHLWRKSRCQNCPSCQVECNRSI
jgi:hypothetical protein